MEPWAWEALYHEGFPAVGMHLLTAGWTYTLLQTVIFWT